MCFFLFHFLKFCDELIGHNWLCVFSGQIEKISDIPLREVLADLGSWPVVEQHWDPSKFVLEDVLGTMRGKYNAPILIDCWVGPDDKNSSVNIIQVGPTFSVQY